MNDETELHFRPGGFRPGELTCADCGRAAERLTIADWHGENERFVCDDCHPQRKSVTP
jgi:hypothetical protein